MERNIRRKPRRHGLRWGRIIGALILLVVFVGLLVWGIRSAVSAVSQSSTTSQESHPLPVVTNTTPMDMSSIKTSYMLLVGVDKSQPQQADALYVIAFNMDAKTLQIIGIPSNSKIINRHSDTPQRINDMYAQGGIELTKAVVEDMFHIVIPYYAVVDQESFQSMMNIFGTPSLYVEQSMVHRDAASGEVDINIHQGYQDMTNDTAFGYMRYVNQEGDTLARTMHQERLLKTMWERERNHVSLGTAFRVWRQWSHISTNISTWDGVRFITKVIEFPKDKVRWYILPGSSETIDRVDYWNVEPIELQQLVGITVGDIPSDAEVIPVIGDTPKGIGKDSADDSLKDAEKQTKATKEDKSMDTEKSEPGSPTTR